MFQVPLKPLAPWLPVLLLLLLPGCELADAGVEATFDERLAKTLEGLLTGGNVWVAFAITWVGGLLTSMTPCVLPLVPITVRYFAGMKGSRGETIRLAFMYVAGMAIFYSTIGTLAAFAGGGVHGGWLANPWVTVPIALLCLAMGASMLGAFTLQLPTGLNTKLNQVGGRSVGGVLVMGLVSGLIAAPCVGPVLLVILALISHTGDVLFGFGLMLSFSLGLGLPFLFLAIFSNAISRLPTSGVWMELVKGVLATAMFLVAFYFFDIAWSALGDALDRVPWWPYSGIGLLLVGTVVAILLLRKTDGWATGVRAAGFVLISAAASLLLFGGGNISASAGGAEASDGIAWIESHDPGIAAARAANKPVMIDFTADWCQACKELDRHTYSDATVQAEAKRFVNLKLDATEITEEMEAIFTRYGVQNLPTVVFLDTSGKILEQPRVTGFVPAPRFLALMREVK